MTGWFNSYCADSGRHIAFITEDMQMLQRPTESTYEAVRITNEEFRKRNDYDTWYFGYEQKWNKIFYEEIKEENPEHKDLPLLQRILSDLDRGMDGYYKPLQEKLDQLGNDLGRGWHVPQPTPEFNAKLVEQYDNLEKLSEQELSRNSDCLEPIYRFQDPKVREKLSGLLDLYIHRPEFLAKIPLVRYFQNIVYAHKAAKELKSVAKAFVEVESKYATLPGLLEHIAKKIDENMPKE